MVVVGDVHRGCGWASLQVWQAGVGVGHRHDEVLVRLVVGVVDDGHLDLLYGPVAPLAADGRPAEVGPVESNCIGEAGVVGVLRRATVGGVDRYVEGEAGFGASCPSW